MKTRTVKVLYAEADDYCEWLESVGAINVKRKQIPFDQYVSVAFSMREEESKFEMIECSICMSATDNIEHAIDDGWVPSYYDGNQEMGVACSNCVAIHLKEGVDGELELVQSSM